MINAHLIDEAEEWWDEYYTKNKNDNGAMGWDAISQEFFEKYCTPRWINKWLKDVTTRKQGTNKTVDSYYTAVKKLLAKADFEKTMNMKQKIRIFIQGL